VGAELHAMFCWDNPLEVSHLECQERYGRGELGCEGGGVYVVVLQLRGLLVLLCGWRETLGY
jgi:hypothetical protein